MTPLNFTLDVAFNAGKILKEGFGNISNIKYKKFADPVTEYDIKIEKYIHERILKYFPNHQILSEELYNEFSLSLSSIPHLWIIDPIDGTVNFSHGIPFVAVSIAYVEKGDVIIGVVYNPILEEMFWAEKNKGAFLNNTKLRVSNIEDPAEALIVTGFPYDRSGKKIDVLLAPMEVILKEYLGMRRLGSAAIDLCYVAAGRFEAFYEIDLKPWDTSAGMLIVEEAMGKVTTFSGKRYNPLSAYPILATNGTKLHQKLIEILEPVEQFLINTKSF